MANENPKKIMLPDGREVWQYTFVRYREVDSGKFISKEEVSEMLAESIVNKDLDQIEMKVLHTLTEIAENFGLAVKSSGSMKMLLGLVEKMKQEKAASEEEEWFILGRQLAKDVLALLEEDF